MSGSKWFGITVLVSLLFHSAIVFGVVLPDRHALAQEETLVVLLTPPEPEVEEVPIEVPVEKPEPEPEPDPVPEEIPEIPEEIDIPEEIETLDPIDPEPVIEKIFESDTPEAVISDPRPVKTVPVFGTPPTSYNSKVLALIKRCKRYPKAAERRGIEGSVQMRLVLARSGDVLEAAVVSGSGTEMLDDAALKMIECAKPFPPFPEDMECLKAEFLVPVDFTID